MSKKSEWIVCFLEAYNAVRVKQLTICGGISPERWLLFRYLKRYGF